MVRDDALQTGTEQPLMAHLLELRSRLLRIVLGVLVLFITLSFFAKQLYAILAQPMLRLLPAGSSMIATEVASPFFAPIKLAAVVAVIAAMPWVLRRSEEHTYELQSQMRI